MSRLINLVLNENMKMIYRPRNWIMVAILLVSVLCITAFMYNGNQNSTKMTDIWSFVSVCTGLLFIPKIFAIVLAGDIVASEFANGTIKLLLIRSANRTKILTSKYIAVVLYTIFFIGFTFSISLILGLLFFPGAPVDSPISFSPMNVIKAYLYQSLGILMHLTFAFMISTVFRSSSLAIGLSMFMMFAGDAFVQLLRHFDVHWGKYLLYANTDLTQYLQGNQVFFEGMTRGFSIAVLITYFAVFHFLSWFSFTKRDVSI